MRFSFFRRQQPERELFAFKTGQGQLIFVRCNHGRHHWRSFECQCGVDLDYIVTHVCNGTSTWRRPSTSSHLFDPISGQMHFSSPSTQDSLQEILQVLHCDVLEATMLAAEAFLQLDQYCSEWDCRQTS